MGSSWTVARPRPSPSIQSTRPLSLGGCSRCGQGGGSGQEGEWTALPLERISLGRYPWLQARRALQTSWTVKSIGSLQPSPRGPSWCIPLMLPDGSGVLWCASIAEAPLRAGCGVRFSPNPAEVFVQRARAAEGRPWCRAASPPRGSTSLPGQMAARRPMSAAPTCLCPITADSGTGPLQTDGASWTGGLSAAAPESGENCAGEHIIIIIYYSSC